RARHSPGLSARAPEAPGLAPHFLRPAERPRLLVHLLDVSGLTGRDPWEDYQVVNRELAAHNPRLAALPRLVALNKADMPDASPVIEQLRPRLEAAGEEAYRISALTGQRGSALVYAVARRLDELPRPEPAPEVVETRFTAPEEESWSAEREEEGVYRVRGRGVERLVVMTDMENEAAVRRMQRILERLGVVRELRELGAKDGDSVRIGEVEVDFLD